MGHERVGTLPRTRRWQAIVSDMASFPGGGADASAIASKTLENVRQQFQTLERDEGVRAAFTFLLGLAVSSRTPEAKAQLSQLGIDPERKLTPLTVAKALRTFTLRAGSSPEHADIAANAAIDAVASWYQTHKSPQLTLFQSASESFDIWHQSANGAGFCELSRNFFAKFTERYLNYFLEREASRVMPTVEARERFRFAFEAHVDAVSQHAFETSKITQSFSAGWFNLHTREGMPSDEEIGGFVSFALGKIRDELVREGVDR